MEAFALRKIEKRDAAKKLELLEEIKSKKEVEEQVINLRRQLGYPEPPTAVYSLGRYQAAAIWWDIIPDDSVISWEIHRYRKNPGRVEENDWKYKGCDALRRAPRNQFLLEGLTNGYQYRFTIKAISDKGSSQESMPSNAVMIEPPLPSGWFRFYDDKSDKFFYANIKTRLTRWDRPEKDPYFLDETVLFNFETREIEFLRSLFDEDIAHFRHIYPSRFQDVMREVGEHVTNFRINRLMRTYGNVEGVKARLSTWIEFMNVMDDIKRRKISGIIPKPSIGISTFIARQFAAFQLKHNHKYENWTVHFNEFVERTYYLHLSTGTTQWTMPDEIRFYVNPKLMGQVLSICNC